MDMPPLPPGPEPAAAARQEHWKKVFDNASCSPTELAASGVLPREPVLGPWFLEGDLGFIYGPRGLGKTWLAMHIAIQIAEGGRVANWQAPKPRRVRYIDGEMPLDGLLKRHQVLSSGDNGNMSYLQHEMLFHKFGEVLNLTDPDAQRAISHQCAEKGIEVLVLDNLSCLFSGIKENDADSWELVLPWLLELRRNRVAVMFIAHAGRNGCMRGTSRREDAAFWILQLTRPNDAENIGDGARFVSRFDKNRNATEAECPEIEWTFRSGHNGRAEIDWKLACDLEKLRHWIENGLTSATDIAVEMGVSKGHVSKLAKIAMQQGLLRHNGREYVRVTTRKPVFSAEEAREAAWGSSNSNN